MGLRGMWWVRLDRVKDIQSKERERMREKVREVKSFLENEIAWDINNKNKFNQGALKANQKTHKEVTKLLSQLKD